MTPQRITVILSYFFMGLGAIWVAMGLLRAGWNGLVMARGDSIAFAWDGVFMTTVMGVLMIYASVKLRPPRRP